jgi:hypothetical protein
MARCARLTIAGMEVPGGQYGDHEFRRPLGVNAPEMIWCLPDYIANKVLALQWTEVTILAQDASEPQVFKKVKVVRETQSDHPHRRYVILSDARFDLPRTYIKENYNLRTAMGQTELLDVAGAPTEIDPVRFLITYATSSLRGGLAPWTADQILDDILTRRLGVKFTRLHRSLGGYEPNDVQIDAPGNIALAQAMAAMGGLDVRVNNEGDFELVDAMLGAERDIITRCIPYSLRHMGMMRWVSLANVAPIDVQVGFDADMEVRADGYLPSPNEQVTRSGVSWPLLDNVVQVTDKQLATTDAATGKTYEAVQGSYLPIDQWFTAVAADTRVPAPPVPTQVRWSREYALRDYMRGLMEFWFVTGNTGGLEPSQAWANRYRAFREHMLKTWRLDPAFARLCLPGSIRAVRARLLDAANQTRQPTPCYMDYCRRPSIRGVRDNKTFGWNNHCIPGVPMTQAVGAAKLYTDPAFPDEVLAISTCTQAPVEVRCADNVAGIFRLGFKKDVHDHTTEIVPALVQRLPTNNLNEVNRGAGLAYWEDASLCGTQRIILVFTAVPAAAPLYYVTVTPEEALSRLGVKTMLTPKGPRFQTRVGPALQSARIAYEDSSRNATQAVFQSTDRANAQMILQLFQPLNMSILKDYSQSVAAVLYAAMLDHFEGEATVGYTPSAMPIGSLVNVTHVVTSRGRVYTRFECKRPVPPVQPIHFMERGARAVIFRSPGSWA